MILDTDAVISENSVYGGLISAAQDMTFRGENHQKTKEGKED